MKTQMWFAIVLFVIGVVLLITGINSYVPISGVALVHSPSFWLLLPGFAFAAIGGGVAIYLSAHATRKP